MKMKHKRWLSLAALLLALVLTVGLFPATKANATTSAITLSLTDSYGDGWNGNKLAVYVDGVFSTIHTISYGNSATYEIPYDSTKTYEFRWVKGSYAGECSFDIKLGGEMVYSATRSDCGGLTNGQVLHTIESTSKFTLKLSTSYGEGWYGSKLALYVDGVYTGDYTITSGKSETHTIPYDTSKTYEFRWVKGSSPYFCSFVIEVDDKAVYSESRCDKFTNGQVICTAEASSSGNMGIVANGSCGSNLTWALEDGVLTISGTGSMNEWDNYSNKAPWYNYRMGINSVVLQEGLTYIGSYAFYDCDALTSVYFPQSVTQLGYSYTFAKCDNLKEICFTGNRPVMSTTTFQNVTATVYCPGGNTSYDSSFGKSYGGTLTWVRYGVCGNNLYWTLAGNKLVIKGDGAMYNWTYSDSVPWYPYREEITAVEIGDGVTSIGNKAFYDLPNLTQVDIAASVQTIGEYALAYCDSLESITIPEGVVTIGEQAFTYSTNLKTVILPDSLDSIEFAAFFHCSSLESITIPAGVSSVDSLSFEGTVLEEIVFEGNAPTFGSDVFYELLVTAYYPGANSTWTQSVIGKQYGGSVNWIPYGSCGDNLSWTVVGGTLVITGTGAMEDWQNAADVPWYAQRDQIANVILPDGITSIGQNAFACCSKLLNAAIPGSVNSIGDNAFCGYAPQKTIYFIGSVPANVAGNAFQNVPADVYYPAADATWTESVRKDYGGNLTWNTYGSMDEVIVASGKVRDNNWADILWYVTADGTLSIKSGGTYTAAMKHYTAGEILPWDACCDQIEHIQFVNVNVVGGYAFDGYTALKDVDLSHCKEVGPYAFEGCTSLKNVYIANSYGDSIISGYAFANCTALEWVAFPYKASILSYAFDGCIELKDLYVINGGGSYRNYGIPSVSKNNIDNDLNLYSEAFAGLNATVHLPSGWYNDSELSYDDYGGVIAWESTLTGPVGKNVWWTYDPDTKTITITGSGAMGYFDSGSKQPWYGWCLEATSVVIEDGITGVPSYSFEYMEKLESVQLPSTLTTLYCASFFDCKSLNNLIIPGSVTEIGGFAGLYRCYALTDVYYMGTAEEWATVLNNGRVTAQDNGVINEITLHFLVPYGQEATCTESGYEPYYQFDDTSVYAGYYDANKQPIDEPVFAPALGHDWQDATCTEAQYCTRCGETGDAALGHNYVNGICTGCGKYYVNFQSATISLAGNIAINFYVELGQPILDDESAFMSFTLPDGTTKTAMLSDAEVSVKNGVTRYVFTCEVHAKQMADMVVAQMHLGDGTAVDDSRSYSVVTYAGYIIAHEDQYAAYPSLVNLLKTMLNYGAYSQIHFGYNVNNLANANLNLSLNDVTLGEVEAYRPKRAGSMTGLEITSVTLILRSETVLRFYYTLASGCSIEDYNFVVNGKAVQPIYNQDNGRYYVDVTNIAAKDLDREYGVTVTNKAGTESLSVIASAMSYVYQVISNPTFFTEDVKDVVKAMYAYNIAANAYFK